MRLDYNVICDWILSKNPENIKKASVAIQAFHRDPMTPAFQKKIQAQKIQALGLAVSTDFAETLNKSFNAFFEMTNLDMDYEKVFKVVPVSPYKLSWEIHNVKNGLAFRKVAEGETIEVYGMSSTKDTIYADKYGGALGWTDELLRGREVAAMMDKAETFRNKFYVTKADAHYLLMATAAASHVTAWQAGADQLRRDIATLNSACYTVGKLLKDKGYGDMANPRFVLFADPIYRARIKAALKATTNIMQASPNGAIEIDYVIEPNFTFNQHMANKIVLAIPGLKAQRADILQPTQFNDTDILSLTYIQAVWAYFGAGIGDSEQFAEIKFA